MKIPEANHSIQGLIDKAHEAKAEVPRPHMGCSQLGHVCDRWLWLSFRWAVQPKFPGRVLRLFRRGQMEEETIVSDLRAIGMDVRSTGSAQSRVDLGCHVSGSLDAIIESGVPEAPKKRHVAEFKTHSKKSFDDLVKEGVEKSKPEHFVQMQLYMHGTKIDRAFYLAVCKDDDYIHTERVRYDKEVAEKYIQRGHRLATDDRMPPPISTDPSWHHCKFCAAHEFCHST
jgi:CRISPR/Cas system-associated exonuclease Cas4 (RecB family)